MRLPERAIPASASVSSRTSQVFRYGCERNASSCASNCVPRSIFHARDKIVSEPPAVAGGAVVGASEPPAVVGGPTSNQPDDDEGMGGQDIGNREPGSQGGVSSGTDWTMGPGDTSPNPTEIDEGGSADNDGGTSGDYETLYASLVVPIVRQFSPQLLLVSAGFDAHADDPLGGMRVSSAQFGRLTAMLAALADECCGGRVVAISEGGYDLVALRESATAAARVLAGEAALDGFERPDASTRRSDVTHAAVVPGLRSHWKL